MIWLRLDQGHTGHRCLVWKFNAWSKINDAYPLPSALGNPISSRIRLAAVWLMACLAILRCQPATQNTSMNVAVRLSAVFSLHVIHSFRCEYVLVREEQLLDIANPKQAARQPPVMKLALVNIILAKSQKTYSRSNLYRYGYCTLLRNHASSTCHRTYPTKRLDVPI